MRRGWMLSILLGINRQSLAVALQMLHKLCSLPFGLSSSRLLTENYKALSSAFTNDEAEAFFAFRLATTKIMAREIRDRLPCGNVPPRDQSNIRNHSPTILPA
jgi:hypothetical protein